MKNIFKFLMVAAALTVAACDEKPTDPADPETPENPNEQEKPTEPEVQLNDSLTFTLELGTIEKEQAQIKVKHNGSAKDTWYGFVTTDLTSKDGALINSEVERLAAESEKISGLKKNTTTTVTLRSLTPDTGYKYIAFGLTEDGEIYGNFASITFTTAKAEVTYTVNSAWTIEYKGEGKIGEETYDHTVAVTSTDKNLYFITAVSKEDFETKGIKAIAEEELDYFKSYVEYYNETYGTDIKFKEVLFEGNGVEGLLLEPGTDWYALAIGVDENDECSGLYAKSEVITIEEEEMTEAYASWIGDWTFTGANGVAWDVKFEKGKSNLTYKMSGWEGPESEGLYVTVDWYDEEGIWIIYSQSLGTYSFGESTSGEVWFTGFDGAYIYPVADIPVCMGGVTEEGDRVSIGYSEEDEEGNKLEMLTMQYIADIAGEYYVITNTEEWPTFPMTITPVETTETRSATAPIKKRAAITKLTKTYRTYGLFE